MADSARRQSIAQQRAVPLLNALRPELLQLGLTKVRDDLPLAQFMYRSSVLGDTFGAPLNHARIFSVTVAFDSARQKRPGKLITLRQKARVIKKSR